MSTNASAVKPPSVAGRAGASTTRSAGERALHFARGYAVLVLFVGVFIALSLMSDAFLTTTNLLNIASQSAPLAIVAVGGTLVIIGGGFDLSTGAIFGLASVVAAWVAVHFDPVVGLVCAPFVGAAFGLLNGAVIVGCRVHSFLGTLAMSLVYRGLANLITAGFLISVADESFFSLGRNKISGVPYSVIVLIAFAAVAGFLLNRSVWGRHVFAVGGNPDAAAISGVPVSRVRMATFAFSGLAAGLAGAVAVSRIGSGQPTAGELMELNAIAAIIVGGTSIYGGFGAVWRSLVGVYLLALIGNGFNILSVNPFYKDLTTGVIIVLAVALAATDNERT